MQTTTLESVRAELQHWRQHRPYLRSPIPPTLREKAPSLLDQHPAPEICKALGITERMLLAWQGSAMPAVSLSSAPLEFVALPAEAMGTGTFTDTLLKLANKVNLAKFKKHKRGQKKPPAKRKRDSRQPRVSTARLIKR